MPRQHAEPQAKTKANRYDRNQPENHNPGRQLAQGTVAPIKQLHRFHRQTQSMPCLNPIAESACLVSRTTTIGKRVMDPLQAAPALGMWRLRQSSTQLPRTQMPLYPRSWSMRGRLPAVLQTGQVIARSGFTTAMQGATPLVLLLRADGVTVHLEPGITSHHARPAAYPRHDSAVRLHPPCSATPPGRAC